MKLINRRFYMTFALIMLFGSFKYVPQISAPQIAKYIEVKRCKIGGKVKKYIR